MTGESEAARTASEATLERVHVWGATTRSLFLRLSTDSLFAYRPGQFVSLALPVGDGAPLVRAYSLASSPDDAGPLEICVDRVPGGPASAHLFELRPGARLTLTGPFGSFLLDEPPPGDLVFVADGTGIAPIRPMVRRALARPGPRRIEVLHGARLLQELLFRQEFATWGSADRRLRWEAVLAPAARGAGENPFLESTVSERYVQADADRTRHFWICGVGDIVRRLRDLLRQAGYERRAVRYEQW